MPVRVYPADIVQQSGILLWIGVYIISPFRVLRLTSLGLCNPYAEHPFLREVLGYKNPWAYYTAMLLDPIIRFNWVFYVIFTSEIQHSALLSFMVSLSEILRRAMWTLFRVENEHCTNVGRFRASRDVPLPYGIPSPTPSVVEESRDQLIAHQDGAGSGQIEPTTSHMASGAQVTPDLTQPASGSLRRRRGTPAMASSSPVQRGIARVGTIMTQAHAQDFERKRRPGGTPLERQATYEGRQRGKAEEPEAWTASRRMMAKRVRETRLTQRRG